MPCEWFGGLAEWSIAAVLKTVELKGSVGSNPTASAKVSLFFKNKVELKWQMWFISSLKTDWWRLVVKHQPQIWSVSRVGYNAGLSRRRSRVRVPYGPQHKFSLSSVGQSE